MAETIYVYLQPEINQKWYITLAIATLIGGLLSIMIWAFKKYWEVNTCKLGPNIGSVFGLSSQEWSETCINAPLERTVNDLKHKAKIDKENAVRPLKSLLDTIQDNIKMIITRTKVATNELKASNQKF
jgi:hypothetical protein